MIQLPCIEPPKVALWVNGRFVCMVNEYEYMTIRAEIKHECAGNPYNSDTGYRFIDKDGKESIVDTDGRVPHHPIDFEFLVEKLHELF